MIKQLKAFRASVPLPGCAIHKQIIVKIKLALSQAVIQEVHHPRPESFNGAKVHSQKCASRDLLHCKASPSDTLHGVFQCQMLTCVEPNFSTHVLKAQRVTHIGDLRFVRMELIQ